jgi:hypothetical protein
MLGKVARGLQQEKIFFAAPWLTGRTTVFDDAIANHSHLYKMRIIRV